MRKLGLSALICTMAVVPYAAYSQESGVSTPDEYVCALTGECADETQQDAAPDEATPSGSPRVSATRGFSLSRPNSAAPRANNPAPRQRQNAQRPAAAAPRAPRPATAEAGRVNLRLAFGNGSSTLSPAAQAEVRAFAQAMQRPQLSSMRFRIEGHTDSSGGQAVNAALSQRRAQAVADYLMAQGVPASRLEVRGFGYDRPLQGRSASSPQNRRVEAVRIS